MAGTLLGVNNKYGIYTVQKVMKCYGILLLPMEAIAKLSLQYLNKACFTSKL